MKRNNLLAATALSVVAVFASAASFAASKAEIDANVNETLTQFNALSSNHQQLLKKAAGVLVFPQVTKAGAGVAGEHGEGVLQVKGKTVNYYSVSSASIGLTLGVAKRSEIIVFTTQEALDKFVNSKGWSIGAGTGITVISGGASADIDSQTMQKPILGFIFAEKGLIADISLEGSKINKIEKFT